MASDKKKQCQLQALLACRLRGLKSWSPPSSKQQLAVLKVGLSDSDSYTILAVGQSGKTAGPGNHEEEDLSKLSYRQGGGGCRLSILFDLNQAGELEDKGGGDVDVGVALLPDDGQGGVEQPILARLEAHPTELRQAGGHDGALTN